jgi:hypothetical protein
VKGLAWHAKHQEKKGTTPCRGNGVVGTIVVYVAEITRWSLSKKSHSSRPRKEGF